MLRRAAGWAIVLLLFLPAMAAGQDPRAADGRVYLLTVGPGELAWERFGHNALLFLDPATGRSTAYDWGRFDFEQPNFIGRFIKGDMLYSSGVEDGALLLDVYSRSGRSVELQQLNLTPEQVQALWQACETGYLPENRQYRYDYFTANCSTRLRDVLDEVLGGTIQRQLQGVPAGTTWRREAERHAAPDWLLWLGFQAGFGRPADRRINAWQQTFIPGELSEWLQAVEVTDAEGRMISLAGSPMLLEQGVLAPVAVDSPTRWWQTGLIGIALGGLMVLLSRLRWQAPARIVAGLWFLLAGVAGVLFAGIWLMTSHWPGYSNLNLLLLSPLGLPVAASLPWPRLSAPLAAGHLGLCVIGALISVLPGIGQENLAIIALALPANAAGAWVAGVRPGRWNSLRPAASNSSPAQPTAEAAAR